MDRLLDIWCDTFTAYFKHIGATSNYFHIKRTPL